MQQEKPSAFLIIKEPPFPASYDRGVYIKRVLGEMEPSFDYAEYTGVVTLLVRALPRSPAELNRLITEAYSGADLDLTRIGPFDDTDGGKGIRVSIYKGVSPAWQAKQASQRPWWRFWR
jgi:hypothetical protein